MTTDPAPQTTPETPAAPPTPKRWNRVTWAVVVAMLVLWGLALIFHKTIRVNFWAWRLTGQPTPEARERYVASLIAYGDRSQSPALRLTRNSKAAAREAGVEVLLGLVQQQQESRTRKFMEAYKSAKMDRDTLKRMLAEVRRPLDVDPVVAQRLRELLDDPDDLVRRQAIDAVIVSRDAMAAPRLESLAITGGGGEGRFLPEVTRSLDDLLPDPEAVKAMARVLAGAKTADVRAQAAECLRTRRSKAALNALVAALADLAPVAEEPDSKIDNPKVRALIQRQMAAEGRAPVTQPATQPDP
ncbi:MAG: hypothetical protein PHU85_19435, partial [Phycisphaerae bacterium]|nr:hypothetical protein [Phycisphaerae bacterium]